jgi:Ribonuclease G/E
MKSCTTKQRDYLQEIAPSKQSIVKFYQSNDTPIFEKYNIETDQDFIWENSFHE